MRIPYQVHRISEHKRPRTVMHEGEKVLADVTEVEVEFVPARDQSQGTLVLRFVGTAATEAKEKFKQDATLDLSVGE